MVRKRSHSQAAREREAKKYPRTERRARMEIAATLRSQGMIWREVGDVLGVTGQRARRLGRQFDRVLRYEERTGKRWDEDDSLRDRVRAVRGQVRTDPLQFNPLELDISALRQDPENQIAKLTGIPAGVFGTDLRTRVAIVRKQEGIRRAIEIEAARGGSDRFVMEKECVRCGHGEVGLSGFCIHEFPDIYGDPKGGSLCACKCEFRLRDRVRITRRDVRANLCSVNSE